MSLSRRIAASLLVTALIGFAGRPVAQAGDLELPVVERVLPNGLEVLVLEDHDIPNVTLYVTWRVGSRNERPGITGLAHFFEHMMFTGGAKYGPRFDPVMESAGGSNNAYTTRDTTVYTDWFPKSALPLIVDLEADRMRGMVFDKRIVGVERGVVASEHRLNMEEPYEQMQEQLWAAAYTAHPYQWGVLGWMVDIQNWKTSDLEEFFDRNYAPNNATIVVVGDVDPEHVFGLVETQMGDIPRKDPPRKIHTKEPPQNGERRVTVESESAAIAQVVAAWHMPEIAHPDFAVFDVLEQILVGGESSRLHRLLVEEEDACLSVGGGWQGLRFDPSLFAVELQMREGVPTTRGEELVYAELARLAAEPVGERELRKVKNGLRADFVRRLKTIDGKADLISETHTFFGGWRNLPRRLERVEAVTADDLVRVVRATFTKRNRTVVTLELTPPAEEEK